jgi:hypothetical protein
MLKKAMKTMNFDEIIGVVDQFGGDVGITVQGNRKLYKTWFGAIGTLMIYSVGAVYFLYLFALFLTNQIPPNVTYLPYFIKNSRYHKLK